MSAQWVQRAVDQLSHVEAWRDSSVARAECMSKVRRTLERQIQETLKQCADEKALRAFEGMRLKQGKTHNPQVETTGPNVGTKQQTRITSFWTLADGSSLRITATHWPQREGCQRNDCSWAWEPEPDTRVKNGTQLQSYLEGGDTSGQEGDESLAGTEPGSESESESDSDAGEESEPEPDIAAEVPAEPPRAPRSNSAPAPATTVTPAPAPATPAPEARAPPPATAPPATPAVPPPATAPAARKPQIDGSGPSSAAGAKSSCGVPPQASRSACNVNTAGAASPARRRRAREAADEPELVQIQKKLKLDVEHFVERVINNVRELELKESAKVKELQKQLAASQQQSEALRKRLAATQRDLDEALVTIRSITMAAKKHLPPDT